MINNSFRILFFCCRGTWDDWEIGDLRGLEIEKLKSFSKDFLYELNGIIFH